MNGIWLVTKGCYSDYGVVAAYSTEDVAKNAVSDGQGDEVEFCELDPIREYPPAGLQPWQIQMKRDGTLLQTYLCRDAHESGNPFKVRKAQCVRTDLYIQGTLEQCFRVDCWARDERHAVKIANEQRTMTLAI